MQYYVSIADLILINISLHLQIICELDGLHFPNSRLCTIGFLFFFFKHLNVVKDCPINSRIFPDSLLDC